MKISKVFAVPAAVLISVTALQASVPIIVATPGHMRASMNLVTEAQDLIKSGDVAGAKRKVDKVLQRDPAFGQRSTCARKFTQAKANTIWR